MKFKFAPADTYKTKVTVLIPGDFGKTQRCEFTVQFKRLKASEYRETLVRLGEAARRAEVTDVDAALLSEVVLGWDGLLDADDQPVSFSPDALGELLDIGCYRHAIFDRFIEGVRNPAEISRKN